MVYDNWCRINQCEHFREWQFSFDSVVYDAFSCELVGQSYNVVDRPDNCPFLKKEETVIK